MKSLRGKPRSIMFLGFNSLLSQQAAGNLTQERLTLHQFLVGAASSREKKSLYSDHRMIAAGSRSHNQNRINYNH